MLLKTKRSSGGQTVNLFLIELIAVLLFFSISAAILLKMFAAANEKSEKSVMNEKVILCSQSMSELFSLNADCGITAEKLFGSYCEKNGDTISVNFTKELTPVRAGDSLAAVSLNIGSEDTKTDSGKLSELKYEFFYNGESFFSGGCTVYVPEFEVTADE